MAVIYFAPSELGDASGSSAANAKGFNGGAGFQDALTTFAPGDEIIFTSSPLKYQMVNKIEWPASASGTSGNEITVRGEGTTPAIEHFGKDVRNHCASWPLFNLRMKDFINFEEGASFLYFEKMCFENYPHRTDNSVASNYVFYFPRALNNDNITIKHISCNDCIELVRFVNATFDNDVKEKTLMGGNSGNFTLENYYLTGHQKRTAHLEGVYNTRIANGFRDCIRPEDDTVIRDWALDVIFETDAHDNLVENIQGDNCNNKGAEKYDSRFTNGDTLVSEKDTLRNTFRNCRGKHNGDSFADVKGDGHIFDDMWAFNCGHRGIRIWNNGCQVMNSTILPMAINKELLRESIDGGTDLSALWVLDGSYTADNCKIFNPGSIATVDNLGGISISNSEFILGAGLDKTRTLQTIDPLGTIVIGPECKYTTMIRFTSGMPDDMSPDTDPPTFEAVSGLSKLAA